MNDAGHPGDLDALIEELTLDAYGDSEALAGFLAAAEEALAAPQIATVVGVEVAVLTIVAGPDERRGLEAVCARNGAQHRVSLADVAFDSDSEIGRVVAAYRRWLGLAPCPQAAPAGRANEPAWHYPGHAHGPGAAAARASAADIERPLEVLDPHRWDPADEYWGDHDEPPADWATPILAAGARTSYEFEHLLPGADDDSGFDPILDAIDRAHAGDRAGARRRLRSLLAVDPRCLDAHAHLGWLAFDRSARAAFSHYQAGVAIAERSLPEAFDGLLPWARLDNRPFLRCLHGLAVSLWRLERWDEAAKASESLLWLNPADNQGASAVLADVRARVAWLPREQR